MLPFKGKKSVLFVEVLLMRKSMTITCPASLIAFKVYYLFDHLDAELKFIISHIFIQSTKEWWPYVTQKIELYSNEIAIRWSVLG